MLYAVVWFPEAIDNSTIDINIQTTVSYTASMAVYIQSIASYTASMAVYIKSIASYTASMAVYRLVMVFYM